MTNKEINEKLEALRQEFMKRQAEEAKKHDSCPNCGRCNHCGRGGTTAERFRWPYTEPSKPFWTGPYIVTSTTGSES